MPAININNDMTPVMIQFMAVMKEDMSIHDIHREINVTYAHLIKIKNMLAEKGFFEVEKIGRIIRCILTPKGLEMKDACRRLLELWRK